MPVPPEVAEALLAQFDWFARFQRAVASPRVVQAFLRANLEMDARPILP
jgi:hypothetical protein